MKTGTAVYRGSATDTTAAVLSIYAALLGIVHGLFEVRQGLSAAGGGQINAIGSPCRPETVWHACLPAMTLIPNMFATGVLAIIVGLAMLIWAVWFVRRRRGGGVLILLSVLLLFVGGGFVSAFVGIVGGTAVTRLPTLLTRLPSSILRIGAIFWPWSLLAFAAWALGGWILGYFYNQIMLNYSTILFIIFDVGLPLVCIVSAIANDGLKTAPSTGRRL